MIAASQRCRRYREVRLRPGKRVADNEVALPDTRLRGKMVDDAGRPVPGAAFTAMSLGERLPPGAPGLTLVVMAPGFALHLVRVLAAAPPDPLEIAVAPDGGVLVLDLPQPAEPGAPRVPQPVLLRDGLLVPWQLLGTWAGFQGQPPSDPTRLVVPQVEAGEYLLCPARRAVDGGTAGCGRGYLAPGGELRLRLPEAG